MTWLADGHYRDSRIESYPGCYNTGHSPAVSHFGAYYYVGKSGDVTSPLSETFFAVHRDRSNRRTFKGDVGTIHRYKTATSARLKYTALCNAAREEHQKRVDERAAIAAKARSGDVGAALTLGLDW